MHADLLGRATRFAKFKRKRRALEQMVLLWLRSLSRACLFRSLAGLFKKTKQAAKVLGRLGCFWESSSIESDDVTLDVTLAPVVLLLRKNVLSRRYAICNPP
jgi:hypothetical protein